MRLLQGSLASTQERRSTRLLFTGRRWNSLERTDETM